MDEVEKAAVELNSADREQCEAALQLAKFRRAHVVFQNHCVTDAALKAEHERLIARRNNAFTSFQDALNRWAMLKTRAELRDSAEHHRPLALSNEAVRE